MIYINQDGQTELGRGETLDSAILMAIDSGFEIKKNEIKASTEQRNDGDVYWTDEPVEDYNDWFHASTKNATKWEDSLFFNKI